MKERHELRWARIPRKDDKQAVRSEEKRDTVITHWRYEIVKA